MVKADRKKLLTGMTGVYYTAAELSARGYIVTITARNAPGADILASTANMKKTFNIQVKANKPYGNQSFWLLSKDAKTIHSPNFFYVFVNLKENQKPDFYIVKSNVVARNMGIDHSKTGSIWHYFSRDEKYKDKWDLLK